MFVIKLCLLYSEMTQPSLEQAIFSILQHFLLQTLFQKPQIMIQGVVGFTYAFSALRQAGPGLFWV